MVRTAAWGLAAMIAIAGCGGRPALEEPAPSFGRGPDAIERLIAVPSDDVWDAVVSTLARNGFKIAFQDHDGLGGDLVAEQKGGRVLVRVRRLDERESSLAVRVEPPDRTVTLQLQEAVARALGWGDARSGASERQTFRLSLDQAIHAAEQTLAALRIGVLDRRRGKDEAILEGRRADSIPVRIRLRCPDGRETDATFVAGASRSDEGRALARRMRQEFQMRAGTS